ncbi:hypothetical protein EG329_010175 [Mollisiaceae sp. DMI_Dod_QoI]|nr:hypothetical protein EG329_010175 [Helotiales sp. DMI_Dod_QoI]
MMYNPQQYAVGVGHQSPYGGAPGPGMGGNAGAMGMMQNNGGMAQMPASHVSTYQTPYSSSPYGGNIPTSTAANLPPNFMPTTSNAPSFPMNAPSMNPQHQAQRMQPPPPSSTPTQPGQRASPFAGGQHNTPPNAGHAQSQFSTPQPNAQTHLQTPNNNQQGQGQTVVTPQTPNFPPGSNAGPIATPLSPGSESREKERVTLLLEINNGLLKEVMRIQAIQAEVKKDEAAAAAASPEGADKEKAEKEKTEKLKTPSREYVECMRRLQSNLAYLAAIADRSHKPSSQIPPHPAIMSAPPLSPRPSTNSTSSPKSDAKKEESEDKKIEDIQEDQSEILKDLYKKLQALFPGVDPKKEPQVPAANAARAQAQQQAAAQIQAQKQQQAQGGGVDPNTQQKMQNDMLRQKMMQQQAQQQAQNSQQQMAQGMQGMNNSQMNNAQQGQVQSR